MCDAISPRGKLAIPSAGLVVTSTLSLGVNRQGSVPARQHRGSEQTSNRTTPTGVPHLQEDASPRDPTVGLCLGS